MRSKKRSAHHRPRPSHRTGSVPDRVVAIDIETDIPEPRGLVQDCQPFLLGVKTYHVEAGNLVAEQYRAYESGSIGDGVAELAETSGVIVGYNLFGFDYVVLQAWLQGTTILERTVDPLHFLRGQLKRFRGLKLHEVCTSLLGEGKVELGCGVSQAWSEGKRDLVLRYNEQDCDLAAKLWWYLVSASEVTIGNAKFEVGDAARRILRVGGQVSGYDDWVQSEFRSQVERFRVDANVGLMVNPFDLAREFDRFVCQQSGKAFFSRLIPASDYPSGEDVEPRHCPICGDYIWDSPYVFKGWGGGSDGWPVRDSHLASTPELEGLWANLSGVLGGLDASPHFTATGFPRTDGGGNQIEDYLGVAEASYAAWIASINPEAFDTFLPRWEERQRWIHRRSVKALEQYALKEDLY